ncbi:hypothetical protein ABKN59_006366 [Abortiporus biennis]
MWYENKDEFGLPTFTLEILIRVTPIEREPCWKKEARCAHALNKVTSVFLSRCTCNLHAGPRPCALSIIHPSFSTLWAVHKALRQHSLISRSAKLCKCEFEMALTEVQERPSCST